MKKVILFLANGFEEIEAIATIDVLRRAKIPVQTVSITDDLLVTGAHDVSISADTTFNKVNFSEVDVLVLPGGMPGPNTSMNMRSERVLKEFNDKRNPSLPFVRLLWSWRTGTIGRKRATCYPGFEPELTGAQTTGECCRRWQHHNGQRSGWCSILPFALWSR